ncbi:MAG: hypothetical protein QM755_13480 [Luteolibacter sp.]
MPSSPSDPPVVDAPPAGAPIEVPKKTIPPPLPGRSGSAAEVRSLDRHACPKCGGKGEWDPAKKQLVCPYCGNIFDRVGPPPDPGAVVEHDLDQTLAELGAGCRKGGYSHPPCAVQQLPRRAGPQR